MLVGTRCSIFGRAPTESYCWFSFALAFQLFRAVESSSLFHLCNLLIFYVLGDEALMSLEAFMRTEQILCLNRGRSKGEDCGHVKKFREKVQ